MPPPWPLRFSTLNICVFSLYPMRHAIRSLAADLIFDEKIYLPPIKEIFSYSPCVHVGTGVLRSNVYFIGGLQPNFFTENPKSLSDSCIDQKQSGKTVFAYNTAPRLPFTIVPDMISPKTDPLVLNVTVGEEERLYVLSDNMYPDIRPPVFESYTLSTNSWEQLDPPPFLNPKSKYFDNCRRPSTNLWEPPFLNPKSEYVGTCPPHYPYASAVIGTSICVSTAKTSFKFDIEKKIWEPCMLFEGLPTPVVDNDYHNCNGYITNDDDDTPCGPPFMGKAVLFEDDVLICICMLPFTKGSVVAYKIEGGKVVDSQSLMAQGLVIHPEAVCPCIADFGNGLFCLVLTLDNIFKPPSILNMMPFFIKKKTVMKPGDFLHCEVINEFKYVEKDIERWYPSCCFAQ